MLATAATLTTAPNVTAGDYVTNSVDLWCVLDVLTDPGGRPAVVLENCLTLVHDICTAAEFEALTLRLVTPATAG